MAAHMVPSVFTASSWLPQRPDGSTVWGACRAVGVLACHRSYCHCADDAACAACSEGPAQQPPGVCHFQPVSGAAGVKGQAWATYVPSEQPPADGGKPRGATIFARDFQTVVLYDSKGEFVGVRRPGSNTPIEVTPMGPSVLCWPACLYCYWHVLLAACIALVLSACSWQQLAGVHNSSHVHAGRGHEDPR